MCKIRDGGAYYFILINNELYIVCILFIFFVMSKFTCHFMPIYAELLKIIRKTNRSAINLRYCHSLIGRTFLQPTDFTCNDIKEILWTAIDLKSSNGLSNSTSLKKSDKWVSFLRAREFYYLPSLARAAHLLGVNFCGLTIPEWEMHANILGVRKYFERECHLLLTQSNYHNILETMYKDSLIPMFNIQSCKCSMVNTLTDLMIYQLHFGRLCGLNVLWFGEVCSLINTYIGLTPLLQMNIRYCCHKQSPAAMQEFMDRHKVVESSKQMLVKEYDPEADKDYRVDVMIVREKSPNWEEMIKLSMNRSPDWIFMQEFLRADATPCPDSVKMRQRHYARTDNLKFTMAAIMLRLLADYQHLTKQPKF